VKPHLTPTESQSACISEHFSNGKITLITSFLLLKSYLVTLKLLRWGWGVISTASKISSLLQTRAMHIFNKTVVVTILPFANFEIKVVLMPDLSFSIFFHSFINQ
jgi:hypothetical protein